jgi:hypothetical protein
LVPRRFGLDRFHCNNLPFQYFGFMNIINKELFLLVGPISLFNYVKCYSRPNLIIIEGLYLKVGLYRISVYTGFQFIQGSVYTGFRFIQDFGLYRISVYSGFSLYRISVYSGFGLDRFHPV